MLNCFAPFEPFWTISDYIRALRTIFGHIGTILGHIGTVWTIVNHFENVGPFGNC